MSKRYIDADKIVINAERGISNNGLLYIPMIDVHRSIDATPTADVVEVRHGRWSEYHVNGKYYGQVYYQHQDCDVDACQLFPSPYEFCPRCGAKMNGERRGENEG
jgi:hypothetical protein